MFMLASLRSDWWSTCPELVDDFIGIRTTPHLNHVESRHVLEGRIGNVTPYAPYVQDPVLQTEVHRGWRKTIADVVAEHSAEVDAILTEPLDMIAHH